MIIPPKLPIMQSDGSFRGRKVSLQCLGDSSGGHTIEVSCDHLAALSPVFSDLFPIIHQSLQSPLEIKVEDDVMSWHQLFHLITLDVAGICHLQDSATYEALEVVLELADKYNMQKVIALCHCALCKTALSSEGLSMTTSAPSFAVRWLNLSEGYQLAELHRICMDFIIQNITQLHLEAPAVDCLLLSDDQTDASYQPRAMVSKNPHLSEMSRSSFAIILQSAIKGLSEAQQQLFEIKSILKAEGLGLDLLQGQVRIHNFDRWRRLAAPPCIDSGYNSWHDDKKE